jgi:hypothetical protein
LPGYNHQNLRKSIMANPKDEEEVKNVNAQAEYSGVNEVSGSAPTDEANPSRLRESEAR